LKKTILTPDEGTEAQRKRRKANKPKDLSSFNVELRRQAEVEVVAQDPDESKEDGPSKRPSEMSITEGEARTETRKCGTKNSNAV
jgi:hypothetical protein